MPLPGNATLPLQGHSRPGDTVHSKPKQAMIVRMSAETLEALESFPQQPQIDFEFGDNPGIHIGAAFFSIRPSEERDMLHELYLRASSVAKPMAPLKLYANVTGKFTVMRDLAAVRNKVRESTLGAVQQHSARQTILIDAPSDLHVPIGKKKKVKQSSMFVKPIQHPDRTRTSVLSSSSTLPPPPIPAQTTTKKGLLPVRKHLVNDSAKATPRVGMKAKEIDEVDEKMGPAIKAAAPARRAPGSGSKVAKSTSQDGRSNTFDDGPSPSPIPRGKPVDVRRKDREAFTSSLPARPTPPVLPLTSHERKSGVGVPPTRMKKVKDVAIARADSDMELRRERGQERKGDLEGGRDRNPERERQRDRGSGSGKDRDRGTENDHKDRESDRLKGKDSGLAASSKRKKPVRELDEAPSRPTAKRRKIEDGPPVPSSSQDPGARDLSFHRKSELLGSHPQRRGMKREMSPPSPNAKKDPSPPPRCRLPSQGKTPIGPVTPQVPTHQGAAKNSKLNEIAKPRRRSPIYTSSQEENKVQRPKRDPPPVPHTTAPTTHSPYAHPYTHPQPRFHPSRSLPADHATLRARYSSSYLEYLTTFHKVAAQRGKIESLLRSGGSGSVGPIMDSDGDVELMEPDDLAKLSAEHKTLQDELESIQQAFLRPGKGESASD